VPNFETFELPPVKPEQSLYVFYFQIVARHQYQYPGLNLTKLVLTYCDMLYMVWGGRLGRPKLESEIIHIVLEKFVY